MQIAMAFLPVGAENQLKSALPKPAHALEPDAFRRVMGSLPTGVTVVTARTHSGRPKGATVNTCASVSLSPPLLLVCLDQRSSSLDAVRETGVFAVNVLGGGQEPLARRFASSAVDKFDGIRCKEGTLKVPLLVDSLAHAECEVVQLIEAGDHTVVIGLVVDGAARDGLPVIYYRRQYGVWPGP